MNTTIMTHKFQRMYTAVLGTGAYRYIESFYDSKKHRPDSNIINLQIRYWIEAVEKYYNLDKEEYDVEIIEVH